MNAENLLENIPAKLPEELVTPLLWPMACIQRIVSQGHASPPGFWYDQEQHEWVLLLEGSAAVEFDGERGTVELRRGSWLNIPSRRKAPRRPDGPVQKSHLAGNPLRVIIGVQPHVLGRQVGGPEAARRPCPRRSPVGCSVSRWSRIESETAGPSNATGAPSR